MLLAVQLAGSELLTFIVYVVQLSPLTTVCVGTIAEISVHSGKVHGLSAHHKSVLYELSQPFQVINILDE